MTISLTEEKVIKLTKKFKKALISKNMTLRKLSKLIGRLVATAPAITPCMLQIRFLQQIHIQSIRQGSSYEAKVVLDQLAKKELSWWVENLQLKQW